jgi:hypothetical protein
MIPCVLCIKSNTAAALCAAPYLQDEAGTYCGAEVVLGNATTNSTQYATRTEGDWYRVQIPLSSWQCDRGSVGGLTNVDRVDFQNVQERDADVCLDNIALV